jgi:hemerythrin superfamily protein
MNAIDLIKNDHRKVEDLFAQITSSGESEPSEQEKILQQIEKELLVHGDIEEQIFYPAVQGLAAGKVEEAIGEHAEVKELLADLLELDIDDDQFDETLTTLIDLVTDHVAEEEAADGILAMARKHLDESKLQDLAQKMQALKKASEDELAA